MSEFLLDNSVLIVLAVFVGVYALGFYLKYFAKVETGDKSIENLLLRKIMLKSSANHNMVGSTTKVSQDRFKVVLTEEGYERVER